MIAPPINTTNLYNPGGSPLLYSRFCTFLAFLSVVLLPSPVAARPVANPAVIKALAAEAYLWGLGPEFIERTSKYNTIIGAPFNAFKYGSVPAAWNNDATNAGDASVLYVSGFVNFDQTPELVLTVPPSSNQYYVVAYYDAYANTIGSIGTRTTPSDTTTSYLLVGPKSPYANKQSVKIRGYEYPVMASDTNVNWFLIRILTNTLIDASDSDVRCRSRQQRRAEIRVEFAAGVRGERSSAGLPGKLRPAAADSRADEPSGALPERAEKGRRFLYSARQCRGDQPDTEPWHRRCPARL